jgi:hypothetical protein
MNFGEAFQHLVAGRSIRRAIWNSTSRLVLVPRSHITVEAGRPLGEALPEAIGYQAIYQTHIDLVTKVGDTYLVGQWSFDPLDIMNVDWEVVS